MPVVFKCFLKRDQRSKRQKDQRRSIFIRVPLRYITSYDELREARVCLEEKSKVLLNLRRFKYLSPCSKQFPHIDEVKEKEREGNSGGTRFQ